MAQYNIGPVPPPSTKGLPDPGHDLSKDNLLDQVIDVFLGAVGAPGAPDTIANRGGALLPFMGGAAAKIRSALKGSLSTAEGLAPIAADPFALKEGPMDRRQFLYRASGVPQAKGVRHVGQFAKSVEPVMNDVNRIGKLLPKDADGEVMWDRAPEKMVNRLNEHISGGLELDPTRKAIIARSPTLSQHFGAITEENNPIHLGTDSEGADWAKWNARNDRLNTLDDKVYGMMDDAGSGVNVAMSDRGLRSGWDDLRNLAASKEVGEGKIFKPPVAEDASPTILSGILGRFGAEMKPELRKHVIEPATQALEGDSAAPADSILGFLKKRFNIK